MFVEYASCNFQVELHSFQFILCKLGPQNVANTYSIIIAAFSLFAPKTSHFKLFFSCDQCWPDVGSDIISGVSVDQEVGISESISGRAFPFPGIPRVIPGNGSG